MVETHAGPKPVLPQASGHCFLAENTLSLVGEFAFFVEYMLLHSPWVSVPDAFWDILMACVDCLYTKSRHCDMVS